MNLFTGSSNRKYFDNYYLEVHQLGKFWMKNLDLCTEFLEFFFSHGENFGAFDDYLEDSYIRALFYRVRLQMGEKFNKDIEKYLGGNKINELQEKKEITICKYNKKYYNPREEVRLKVYLKNIPKLSVQVYEINLENYFCDKLEPFDNSISLEGIIPAEVQVYDES